jgi:NAD(P)-dependent dehydrogenase (short-subunit alcohol dehydrogenase family)
VADLADPSSVCALVEAAGKVDILVNNAAIFPIEPTISPDSAHNGFDTAAYDATFATNVRAPYLLTAAFARGMVARGSGAIVNVSSMAARIGMQGLAVYSATKAALESLTRTWAAELSPAGVRVNAVAPGRVSERTGRRIGCGRGRARRRQSAALGTARTRWRAGRDARRHPPDRALHRDAGNGDWAGGGRR